MAMKQTTLTGFEKFGKTTRRAQFRADILNWRRRYRRPTRRSARMAAVLVSSANVHDRDALPHLLHGKETRVWGDQGHQGRAGVIHARAPKAKDFTNRRYRYNGKINEVEKAKSGDKSRVRAKVKHVFGVIKNIIGLRKTRYCGLAKNLHRLEVTAALTNQYMVQRQFLRT